MKHSPPTWLQQSCCYPKACHPQRSPPHGLKSVSQMSSTGPTPVNSNLFLVQCTLNFCNHPDTFTSDSDKVTFVLSYLKGTALDWFKPSLTSGESPPWLNDYSNFIGELKNNFRPHDPKGEAEADLKNLKMRDNQHIVKYLVNFNHLTACVQWGDATLHQQMYRRLPSHIKDEIARISKPDTLYKLCSLTQSIDS